MTTDEMTTSLKQAERAIAYVSGWAGHKLDSTELMELSAAKQAVRDVKRALESFPWDCPDCDRTGEIALAEGHALRGAVTCPRCSGSGSLLPEPEL